MQVLTKKSPIADRPPRKALRWAFLEDFSLFISLLLARLMVRRVLHIRRKERAARLKHLRVISGDGRASAGKQTSQASGMDERGMLREATHKKAFPQHY